MKHTLMLALVLCLVAACAAVARIIAARAFVRKALKGAALEIELFAGTCAYTQTLLDEHEGPVEKFIESLKKQRQIRLDTLAAIDNIKPPNTSVPLPYIELEKRLSLAAETYFQTLKRVFVGRMEITIVLGGYEATIAQIPEILLAFSFEMMGESASFAVAEHIIHAFGDLTNLAGDFLAIPGIWGCLRTAHREIQMVRKGEAHPEEAFAHGVTAAGKRLGLTALGTVLGIAAFGPVGLIIGSIAGSFVASRLEDRKIREEIKMLLARRREIVHQIELRQEQALRTINLAVAQLLRLFVAEMRTVPDIKEEATLKAFTKRLLGAYNAGLVAFNLDVTTKAKLLIRKLPGRTWLDKILGIDRSHEVAQKYWIVVRKIHSIHAGLVNEFSKAAEKHPVDMMEFVSRNPSFKNVLTATALQAVEAVMNESAENYMRLLTTWEERCAKVWEEQSTRVSTITKEENDALEAFAATQLPILKSIDRQILANKKRLRIKPEAVTA